MQYLGLFLLAGLGLASAYSIDFDSVLSTDRFENVDEALFPVTRRGLIGDRLKQAFENLVNKMKKADESGSGISEEIMKRAEDMYEKMKNLNVEISEKTRTIFEDLKSKFGMKSGKHLSSEGDRLKKEFEDLVNGMKLVVDVGKGLPDSLMKLAEDMYEKLKSLHVEISDDIKSSFEEVRTWMGRHSVQHSLIANKLKEAFEEILNRMKEAFESGKGIPGELMKRAEDIFEKMKSMKITVCDRNLKLFEDLRSKMDKGITF